MVLQEPRLRSQFREGRLHGEQAALLAGSAPERGICHQTPSPPLQRPAILAPVDKTARELPKGSHQKKSTFLSDIVQKGGGVQPESKSFEVVLFSPILTLFWTLNGGGEGGFTLFQKF